MALYRGNGGNVLSSPDGTFYVSEAQKHAAEASISATTATTKANEATTAATNSKTSETNSKTSETNAKTSETNSKTSETNSKTSETNSANSASLAQQWATKTDAEVVAGQGFGAKKYADEAAATLASKANDAAVVHNTGDETINGLKTFTQNVTVPSLNGGPLAGMRNKIINGNFDIWQRGTSQTSNGYGSDDRWNNVNAGSTKTASRQIFALGQTDVPGNPKYFSRTVVSSVAGASNRCIKAQAIESVLTLAGKKATLSFYAKADANKNIAIEFFQNMGSGGTPSPNVSGIGSQLVALTTAWKKYTITVDIPPLPTNGTLGTDGNDHLWLAFWLDAGSDFNTRAANLGQQSGTFDIAQVQLEEGSVATPFEQRPEGLELTLCRRYLVPLGLGTLGRAVSDVQIGFYHPFNPPMRGIPSAFLLNGSLVVDDGNANKTSTATGIAGSASDNWGVRVFVSGFAGLAAGQIWPIASSNRIYLQAEL